MFQCDKPNAGSPGARDPWGREAPVTPSSEDPILQSHIADYFAAEAPAPQRSPTRLHSPADGSHRGNYFDARPTAGMDVGGGGYDDGERSDDGALHDLLVPSYCKLAEPVLRAHSLRQTFDMLHHQWQTAFHRPSEEVSASFGVKAHLTVFDVQADGTL